MPAIVADAEQQLQPLSDDDMDRELATVMGALGIGLPQSEKKEWLGAALIYLEKYPAGLCREALQQAVLECDGLRSVLKFVDTYCEDYPQRMRARLEKLRKLHELAKGQGDV